MRSLALTLLVSALLIFHIKADICVDVFNFADASLVNLKSNFFKSNFYSLGQNFEQLGASAESIEEYCEGASVVIPDFSTNNYYSCSYVYSLMAELLASYSWENTASIQAQEDISFVLGQVLGFSTIIESRSCVSEWIADPEENPDDDDGVWYDPDDINASNNDAWEVDEEEQSDNESSDDGTWEIVDKSDEEEYHNGQLDESSDSDWFVDPVKAEEIYDDTTDYVDYMESDDQDDDGDFLADYGDDFYPDSSDEEEDDDNIIIIYAQPADENDQNQEDVEEYDLAFEDEEEDSDELDEIIVWVDMQEVIKGEEAIFNIEYELGFEVDDDEDDENGEWNILDDDEEFKDEINMFVILPANIASAEEEEILVASNNEFEGLNEEEDFQDAIGMFVLIPSAPVLEAVGEETLALDIEYNVEEIVAWVQYESNAEYSVTEDAIVNENSNAESEYINIEDTITDWDIVSIMEPLTEYEGGDDFESDDYDYYN